jgi:hypothetical protein
VEFSVRTSRQRRLPILDVIIFFLSIGYAGGVVSTADELQHQQTGAEEQPPGGLGRAELVRQHDEGAAQHEVHDENDNGDPLRSVQTARRKWIAHIILFVCFFFLVARAGSSLSRVSSSSPSSTTPTEAEGGPHSSYHSPAHAASSEIEDEAPPPPIASRPERTKSIVSINRWRLLARPTVTFLFLTFGSSRSNKI